MLRTAVVVVTLLAIPGVAIPCGNGVMLAGNKAARHLKKAEKALEKGQNRKVIRLTDEERYYFEERNLARRAEILNHIAVTRLGEEPVASLWYFLKLLAADSENPVMAARVAEAMLIRANFDPEPSQATDYEKALPSANAEKMRADALAILLDLEKRDLMPDAFAYATLAQLHVQVGDVEVSEAALKRCRKMTRVRKVCKPRWLRPSA